MTFNEMAENMLMFDEVQQFKPHAVSHEEAMQVLKKSADAGLLHLAYVDKDDKEKKIHTICSCCSCCCENLGSILRFGMAPHVLKASTSTSTDESNGTGCGVCVDRCHFGARKVENSSLMFDKKRCYGCGLYVTTCTAGAITLHQLSS